MTLSIIKSLKLCFKYIIMHIFSTTSSYWNYLWYNLELLFYLNCTTILYTIIAVDMMAFRCIKSLKIIFEYSILNIFRTWYFCWNYFWPNLKLLYYLNPYHNTLYIIIADNIMKLSNIKSLKISFKYIILNIFRTRTFCLNDIWRNL